MFNMWLQLRLLISHQKLTRNKVTNINPPRLVGDRKKKIMKTINQIKDCQAIDLGYNSFADLVLHPKKDMKMNHINWCIERSMQEYAEQEKSPKWIKVKNIPQPKEGDYWVVVNGELKKATVNSKELIHDFKDDMDKSGFWDYSDYAEDERLYPTHYLPYSEGLPKLP